MSGFIIWVTEQSQIWRLKCFIFTFTLSVSFCMCVRACRGVWAVNGGPVTSLKYVFDAYFMTYNACRNCQQYCRWCKTFFGKHPYLPALMLCSQGEYMKHCLKHKTHPGLFKWGTKHQDRRFSSGRPENWIYLINLSNVLEEKNKWTSLKRSCVIYKTYISPPVFLEQQHRSWVETNLLGFGSRGDQRWSRLSWIIVRTQTLLCVLFIFHPCITMKIYIKA